MEFVKSGRNTILAEIEIMNSQPEYNLLADGKEVLDEDDLLEEQEEKKELGKERYLIKVGNRLVGIMDFIMENPRDQKPWLGLMIIHRNWTRKSYGAAALAMYEEMMRERGIKEIRLGCLTDNTTGMAFWEKHKFNRVEEIIFRDKPLWVMEKQLKGK